jgi:hypothetical protein
MNELRTIFIINLLHVKFVIIIFNLLAHYYKTWLLAMFNKIHYVIIHKNGSHGWKLIVGERNLGSFIRCA